MTDNIAVRPATTGRQVLIAAVLSAIAPGFGQLYNGQLAKGIAGVLIITSRAIVIPMAILSLPPPFNVFIPVLFFLAVYVWLIVDAIRTARRQDSARDRKRWQRWYVYVSGLALLWFGVHPALTGVTRATFSRALKSSSVAMEPTIMLGDYFLVRPRPAPLHRGAVVIFTWPDQDGEFVMRAVGLPGDTLQMRAGVLSVNGRTEDYPVNRRPDPDMEDPAMQWQAEHTLADVGQYHPTRDNWGPLVVPAEAVFVLGDNRNDSFDSRFRGLASLNGIRGVAGSIYFSHGEDGAGIRWERIGIGIE